MSFAKLDHLALFDFFLFSKTRRIVSDSLYLLEVSLNGNLEQNALKLVFPAPLVPDPSFFSVEKTNFALKVRNRICPILFLDRKGG